MKQKSGNLSAYWRTSPPCPPSPADDVWFAAQLGPPAPPLELKLCWPPPPAEAASVPPIAPSPPVPAASIVRASDKPVLAVTAIAMLGMPAAVSSLPTTAMPATSVGELIDTALIAGVPGAGLASISVR